MAAAQSMPMESNGLLANSCRSSKFLGRLVLGLLPPRNGSSSTSKPKSQSLNVYVIILALLASVNSIMAGYCIGVTSDAVIFIRKDLALDEEQEQMVVACLVMISMVGNVFAGRLADTIGRKKTMAMGAFVSLAGSTLMAVSPCFWILMGGRIISGISVGIVHLIVPLYIAEISPPEIRGMLISLPEILLNLGILLGYLSGYLLSRLPPSINWRIMFILGNIPAAIIAIAVWWMPETPRWLVMTKSFHKAAEILRKTSSNCKEDEVDLRIADMVAAFEETSKRPDGDSNEAIYSCRDLCGDGSLESRIPLLQSVNYPKKSRSLELICPTPEVGRIILIAMAFQFFNQASGVPAILYYAPTVFTDAGLGGQAGALKANVMVGISKTLFILIATMLVDRKGRKPLLFASGAGMSISMTALATTLFIVQKTSSAGRHLQQQNEFEFTGPAAVVAACSYVAFFSIGFGPINNLLLSELFPSRLRALGMGLSMVVNRSLGGIISLCFLTVSDGVSSAATFFAFALVSAFSLIFVYFFVPETRGKQLEAIHATEEAEFRLP